MLSTVAWADTDKGFEAYEAENYLLAYEEFQKSAEKGDPVAQYMIGGLLYSGDGVAENKTEAARWFRLSAEQRDSDAQYLLGIMYDDGEGVNQDKGEAAKWYRMASEQGNLNAKSHLAWTYLGEGKISEAIALLRDSASHNNLLAQILLGSIYESGEYVDQDLNEAVLWFTYAANQGDVDVLNSINNIKNRDDYTESYTNLLRSIGITRSDADALFCENFLWDKTFDYKLESHDKDLRRLLNFSDKSFRRISDFRKGLHTKFKKEKYEENPAYKELVISLDAQNDAYRQEIKDQLDSGQRLGISDRIIVDREESGIFELVFRDEFRQHVDPLTEDEQYGLWDYCTTTYTPGGWFKDDIGLDKLQMAIDNKPLKQRVYYSSVNYGVGIVDWSKTKYQQIKEIDICEGDLDLLGGVAIGTAATSVLAGESVLMIIGSSGVYVATAPAVATGVTVTAITGATVYAGARGYCYLFNNKKAILDTVDAK
jgi:hypothetical protein